MGSFGVGGGSNYEQQARVAAEQGTGGPGHEPGSGDKRAVLLLAVGLVVFAIALFLIGR